MADSSVQQPIKIGWLLLCPRPNNIYNDRIVIGILGFWTDHDDVHLWEMRQSIYREEKPDQASKDPCRFFINLFLWGIRQRVQPSWHQKEAWSGLQQQLDLRSMRSVLQQTGYPSTPSCPARETRGQAEPTDEETSSTWIRTQPKAATYRVTTNKYPPRKEPSCSRHGGSTWRPRDQSLYRQHWQSIRTEEATGNRVQDRYNFALHEMTASTFTEMVHRIFREQITAFKINLSFGFILRYMETGELRYYHSSQNNSTFFLCSTPHQNKRRLGEIVRRTTRPRHIGVHPTHRIRNESFICWPMWRFMSTSCLTTRLVPESSFQTIFWRTKLSLL